MVAEPVSTLDLPATMLDYAGVAAARADCTAAACAPLIEGDGDARDFAYSEWDLNASRCGVELKLRTVRTRTHKLTIEEVERRRRALRPRDDPHEMDNRFDDPGCAKVRKELEAMIAARPDDARRERQPAVGMA